MKLLLPLFILISSLSALHAQQNRFYFRKLTVADGLGNGGVISIGQDKQGFMWFITRSGLNRFDGNSIKKYAHIPGDSTSIPTDLGRSMAVDSNGKFFVGLERGMLEYNYETDRFIFIEALKDVWVSEIFPVDRNTVFLATNHGLIKYHPIKKTAFYYRKLKDELFNTPVYDIARRNNELVIVSNKGLCRFDLSSERIQKIDLPIVQNKGILGMETDNKQNLWLAISGDPRLIKFSPDLRSYRIYNQYLEPGYNTIDNFTSILADKKGRIWITTQLEGLLLYNESTDKFEQFLHDPLKVWTPSTNLHSSVFNDRDGVIWVGGNNGINYVNPDKNLFRIIPIFDKNPDTRNRRVARVATEDKNGKLWFATIDGLVKFDPVTNAYREWNNREGKIPTLHYNSIRSVLCDDNNKIWIATGRGINQYRQQENRMVFYSKKDSVINGFFFSIDKDKNGNIWFACRDGDGFYYYNPADKKFRSISSFPGLKIFSGIGGRKFFQDSKGRYWLGFNVNGIGMFDPVSGNHYKWMPSQKGNKGISGATVIDIKEDKNGIIWISTYTGLTSIDPQKLTIKNYNHTNGLTNNSTSSLAVDSSNRLWIGTGNGLMMFDSSRTYFTTFGLQDGLPSIEFPEHPASLLENGEIIFPTQNGFIQFDPAQFKKEKNILEPFFTTLTVSGKPMRQIQGNKIDLNYDENFFTIGFASINYENSAATWYAYKLEGVDDEWKYTQNRFADYTKIPGGDYTFRVRASSDRTGWIGPQKTISITIKTEFYKTTWFRIVIAMALAIFFIALYQYRIRQQRKMMDLKSKAQLLEKEKALMMYESLKQQLNPHFLFNSLTSLSGLIETDPPMAGNFLDQMSKIYRYILKNRESELVSLKEELNFVQVYINLQKTRFKEGLQVNIQVPEKDLDKKIAPVTLQNLVENAMKHNIIDADTPLIIDITSRHEYLIIKNNLQRKNMVETSNKQGLASLQSLYGYFSKRPVIIEEDEKRFIIQIPLI